MIQYQEQGYNPFTQSAIMNKISAALQAPQNQGVLSFREGYTPGIMNSYTQTQQSNIPPKTAPPPDPLPPREPQLGVQPSPPPQQPVPQQQPKPQPAPKPAIQEITPPAPPPKEEAPKPVKEMPNYQEMYNQAASIRNQGPIG